MMRQEHPTAFDLELDSERGRWLRKRFLWFCAVNVLVSVPMLPGALSGVFRTSGTERIAALVFQGSQLCDFVLFALAFAYAWKTPPDRARILRLAFLLSCLAGLLLLISFRAAVAIDPRAVMPRALAALDKSSRSLPPTSAPSPANIRLTPETLAMFILLYLLLGTHLLTCLFIPWTTRESLPLTGSLLAAFLVIIGVDTATSRIHPFFALGGTIIVFLLVIPGLAICWRRDRRFRRQFQLQFESRGYRRFQHELSDARRVHESCLPAPITTGPIRLHYVYEPMRQIGGDLMFVHVPPTTDGSVVSAVLLDVTGHGIAAALTVNRIVGELQRIFGENPDAMPGQVLIALNRYVCVTLARHDLYMSAICLRANANDSLLSYANGGHPSAFLRRHDGRIEMLDSTTFLLGLMDGEFSAEAVELPFHPGDAVVAYTDGAAEAKNDRNTMLGMAGVQRILELIARERNSPADWPGQMLRRVLDYRGAPPDDDTLVTAMFRPV
jgi:serine phosphatase RsbU (regulator of sigma subunit)